MTSHAIGRTTQTCARIGGILYLFVIAVALFGEVFVRGRLIVSGDVEATAQNILRSETLFRVGLAGEMLTCVCDVALALILYVLLEAVSRSLALLGALFRLTFVAIYGVAKLFEIAALVVLDRADYETILGPQHVHVLAHMFLRVHAFGYGVSLLFFGFCCVVFGHLIRNSGYLPKTIGVLLLIGGVGYIVFSVSQMLAPVFAARVLFPWIMLPAFPAELGLALWLLVKGVDIPKWEERAQVPSVGGC